MDASTQPDSFELSKEQLQNLIDSIEIDGIYMLNATGHVLTWNRGAEHNKGYRRQEILGKHYSLFFTPEDAAAGLPESILSEAALLGRKAGEGWRMRKNGERFWASFVLTAMRDDRQQLLGYSKVIRDLTDRKLQEDAMRALQAALQEERDRLHAAAESSLDALFICEAVRDPQGRIEDFTFTFLNSNAQKVIPIPQADLLGSRMRGLLPACRTLAFFDQYCGVVETGQPFIHEYSAEDPDPLRDTWLRMQAVCLHDGVAITIADISERKQYQLQIEYLAQHDPLTGLLNRNRLDDRIQQAIARAARGKHMVGFLILDLDGFKRINDTYGHTAGDTLLRTVAQRFSSILRITDTLVRIGGDEFILIIPDLTHLAELNSIVRKLIDCLQPPISIDSQAICQTCSIGIAVYPETHQDPAELIRRADMAMYASKDAGRNLSRVFIPHPADPAAALFFSLDELPAAKKASASEPLRTITEPRTDQTAH
jgi:diguanylate cyclase (GGDEF)-like protein/PAS domain S-box-containing protein